LLFCSFKIVGSGKKERKIIASLHYLGNIDSVLVNVFVRRLVWKTGYHRARIWDKKRFNNLWCDGWFLQERGQDSGGS